MKRQGRTISFPYNRDKATQAILWLLQKHNGSLYKLQLVKLLYYADREHLARYGRPVVGGSYFAMKHGPVSSELLNHLNEATPDADLPFVKQEYRILTERRPNEDELSESDIEVLEYIDREYGRHDRFTLRDLTHKLKAWKKNYPNPKLNERHPLPYEDFFCDLKDKSILQGIREDQEVRSVFQT